jgi:coenzyme F420-reducing hydrogenase gamma subunit
MHFKSSNYHLIMKKIVLLTSVIILLSSCNKKKDINSEVIIVSDSVVAHNLHDYEDANRYANATKKVLTVDDTACINAKKRAIIDIKNGKLVYYFYGGIMTTMCEVEKVKKLFLKKGIKVNYGTSGCIPNPDSDRFFESCYEETMNTEFERRYKKAFIDSMQNIRSQQKMDCQQNYLHNN